MRFIEDERGQTETSLLLIIGGAVLAAIVVGAIIKSLVTDQIQPEVNSQI